MTATGSGWKASAVNTFRACKAQRNDVRLTDEAKCRCNTHKAPGSERPTNFEIPLHGIDARSLAGFRPKYRASPSAGQWEHHCRRFRDACNPAFLTPRSRTASRAASIPTRAVPPSSPMLEVRRSPLVKAGRISQHPLGRRTNGELEGSDSRMRIVVGRSFVGRASPQQGGGHIPDSSHPGPGTARGAFRRTRFRSQDRGMPDGHRSGRIDHRNQR